MRKCNAKLPSVISLFWGVITEAIFWKKACKESGGSAPLLSAHCNEKFILLLSLMVDMSLMPWKLRGSMFLVFAPLEAIFLLTFLWLFNFAGGVE